MRNYFPLPKFPSRTTGVYTTGEPKDIFGQPLGVKTEDTGTHWIINGVNFVSAYYFTNLKKEYRKLGTTFSIVEVFYVEELNKFFYIEIYSKEVAAGGNNVLIFVEDVDGILARMGKLYQRLDGVYQSEMKAQIYHVVMAFVGYERNVGELKDITNSICEAEYPLEEIL